MSVQARAPSAKGSVAPARRALLALAVASACAGAAAPGVRDARATGQDEPGPAELRCFLREGWVTDLDDEGFTLFGTGVRQRSAEQRPEVVLYRAEVALGEGGPTSRIVWSRRVGAPVQSIGATLRFARGADESVLAVTHGEATALLDAEDGRRLALVQGPSVLDHRAVPGVGVVTLTTDGRRVTAHALAGDGEARVLASAAVAHVVGGALRSVDVDGDDPAVRVVLAQAAATPRLTLVDVLALDLGAEEMAPVALWSTETMARRRSLRVALDGERYAVSGGCLAPPHGAALVGRLPVGPGADVPEPLLVQNGHRSARGPYVSDRFGAGLLLVDGALVVSWPGNVELSGVTGFDPDSGERLWAYTGGLGAQRGTALVPVEGGAVAVFSGGLGVGAGSDNGRLEIHAGAPFTAEGRIAVLEESDFVADVRAAFE